MTTKPWTRHLPSILQTATVVLFCTACHPKDKTATGAANKPNGAAQVVAPAEAAPGAYDIILAPHQGDGKTDREIIRQQANVRAGKNAFQSIERLGWLYVAKARESFDPGYYKLAEQCAICLESRQPHCPEALLLRGHVLQNLHRFKEAEPLARELVQRRGRSFDYGLLGDVLMEQGRLDEAVEPYQKMADQRPDMQAYARIAHLRWLKGDLAGATEVMKLATDAASPNAPEPAAWVNTRLAFFDFQQGDRTATARRCGIALDYQADYAPALLLRGRLLLADGKNAEAVETLQRAEQLNPLPDYQWVLSEALHAAGRDAEAAAMEARLSKDGAAADPRTFALYLATKGESPATALQLAKDELNTRGDVFTHDALAWSLAANGRNAEAYQEMQRATAEGTRDARLFFHATVIAADLGHTGEAQQWLDKASGMWGLLLPSEQKQLRQSASKLGLAGGPDPGATSRSANIFTSRN